MATALPAIPTFDDVFGAAVRIRCAEGRRAGGLSVIRSGRARSERDSRSGREFR